MSRDCSGLPLGSVLARIRRFNEGHEPANPKGPTMDPNEKQTVLDLVSYMIRGMEGSRLEGEGMNYGAVASLAVAAAVDDLDATVSRLVSELKQIRQILDNR